MATLSTKARKGLDDSQFAYPKKDALPINDAAHVKAAMSRFGQQEFDSDADKSAAAKAILKAAKKFGVQVSDDNPLLKLSDDTPPPCDTCDGEGKILEGNRKCPDCNGSGIAVEADDDGPADMAELTSLYALEFGEPLALGEGKPIPFLTTGQWDFNEYGPFQVTRDDLQIVKQNFDENVRRQKLPIINEAHDPNRAIGWIKGLEWNGPDRLDAVPDWTKKGEQLIADEAYGYTSPELDYRTMLLHNWADPEHPGVKHPTVAAGLALTNFPKIKKLGAIAASEGRPGCELIACSESPISADHPMRAALLMADPDNDGDDDGPTPPCINQPPNGCCPGYTRRPGDDDGDGTCLMADKGCNGYIAVGNSAVAPTWNSYFGERPQTTTTPSKGTQMSEATPQTPEAPSTPEGDQRALMAENAELAAKFAESEKRNVELAERVAAMERRERVSDIKARFAEVVRTGRATPAEVEAAEKRIGLSEDATSTVQLSERGELVLGLFEERAANSAVKLAEIGTAGNDAPTDAHQQLVQMAEEIRKGDPSMSPEQAYAKAMTKNMSVAAEAAKSQSLRVRG